MTASSNENPSRREVGKPHAGLPCPTWCTWQPGQCTGDHFSSPGEGDWSFVEATGDPEAETVELAAAPAWNEAEGWAPAVVLYVPGVEFNVDLTPDQAVTLSARLLRAATAARNSVTRSDAA